ncbi:putative selenate reductase [Aequitasia blattaphilus]|uniref:dihydrouracil dehydrogenase (NAD(+)) n=1 Tax=Aequitasia blattaphilus TaxID=2949332 RepID=A0ABT1E9N1_9FIRM|nr:putative selenate reductase subunit YgfK [Aequitasia blattaphilus]MCP1102401.1 putative selenate reductase subunit YgfK [Aequitasia blattaphilus]MCR8615041.1 putative selenate reductase subunit YgfK [Aequitasia blattaphilus]
MSDRMTPMPISQLVEWAVEEKKKYGTVFGVYRPYKAEGSYNRTIFGRNLETPIGPAAGPHTQLAQNIIAAYYAGCRFFELKTVQIMDGDELSACVSKPCINADDECYNVEWSTELYVPQAMEEYIKAWFVLSIIAKEYELGASDGFQFNMSVGYDLAGIQSEKVNTFIDSMIEAKDTKIFQECKRYLKENINLFTSITEEDIEGISSRICNSVTLSTLHGCPPQEIEKIANHLIDEKGLHTFIKCNPTLLGYEYARKTMDEMGYGYVAFGEFHFLDDLQYKDAIPMLHRLMEKSKEKGVEFGVKITNTFPVDIKQNELPGDEMYMSGKSLYPLSMSVAARLTKDFDGKLRISYSGGAEAHNIEGIIDAGIWPVTVATTLLKPGGYQRGLQLAEKVQGINLTFDKVSVEKTEKLVEEAKKDPHHVKAVKPLPIRKVKEQVPLIDCFMAPCREGCPINQDITRYIELTRQGQYEEALKVIMEKNPLPFTTGTICPHKCMSKCTRNFYEEPVQIRGVKLIAAEKGYEAVLKNLPIPEYSAGKKAAIVGGGPAGLAAAYFLAKGGVKVTIYEKRGSLGGVVGHVIPEFRIAHASLEKDIALIIALGVEVKVNTEIKNIQELKDAGYDTVILAIGSGTVGKLELEGGETRNALRFLEQFKKQSSELEVGKSVVVVGGGNTAMDTARAAKRIKGVEKVSVVYRRTRRYMPADEEELVMALKDGVEFHELLIPKKREGGNLFCTVMELSGFDAYGRRDVKATDKEVIVPADTVIAAVGEQISSEFLESNGIKLDAKKRALVNEETLESSVGGVYVIGDGLLGPSTVVSGIRDARKATDAILKVRDTGESTESLELNQYYEKRGILEQHTREDEVDNRCLGCASVCENCAEVCPNRANIAIQVPGLLKHQIVHVDSMCNECGNCRSFCPYDSAPYLDKFTLFANAKDMEDSTNQGFTVLDKHDIICQVRYLGNTVIWKKGEGKTSLPKELCMVMETVCRDYPYLWE